MPRTVLVTGVSGFIGRHLAPTLVERGWRVMGVGRSSRCSVPDLAGYRRADVLNASALRRAARGVDAVVHLAALTAHVDIVNPRSRALEINAQGTRNALDAFHHSETARTFIFPSTGKVYGKIRRLPLAETHPLEPLNLLGKSKRIAENLVDFYAKPKRSYVIFRIFQAYGPSQRSNFLVPTILKQLLSPRVSKKTCQITLGDIRAKRDYIYIEDVIQGFVKALEGRVSKGVSAFNLCSGRGTSAAQIVAVLGKLLDLKVRVRVDRARLRRDEQPVEYGSFKKAQRLLGWKPKHSLRAGLAKILREPLF